MPEDTWKFFTKIMNIKLFFKQICFTGEGGQIVTDMRLLEHKNTEPKHKTAKKCLMILKGRSQ